LKVGALVAVGVTGCSVGTGPQAARRARNAIQKYRHVGSFAVMIYIPTDQL
jgi:hypothetical protein